MLTCRCWICPEPLYSRCAHCPWPNNHDVTYQLHKVPADAFYNEAWKTWPRHIFHKLPDDIPIVHGWNGKHVIDESCSTVYVFAKSMFSNRRYRLLWQTKSSEISPLPGVKTRRPTSIYTSIKRKPHLKLRLKLSLELHAKHIDKKTWFYVELCHAYFCKILSWLHQHRFIYMIWPRMSDGTISD